MASCHFMDWNTVIVLLGTLLYILQYSPVSSTEFQVGDTQGWVIPPSTGNDSQFYNQWASKFRFQVGDTIRFKYKKDSVMLVSEEDYNTCNSTHPLFFSNSGNTNFKLGYAGPFYFMSGAAGHCEKGEHMVIIVMSQENGSSSDHHGGRSSGTRAVVFLLGICHIVFSQFVLSYFFGSFAL